MKYIVNNGGVPPSLKNAGLSIMALALSILGGTFILGIIFAMIDLAKNDMVSKQFRLWKHPKVNKNKRR